MLIVPVEDLEEFGEEDQEALDSFGRLLVEQVRNPAVREGIYRLEQERKVGRISDSERVLLREIVRKAVDRSLHQILQLIETGKLDVVVSRCDGTEVRIADVAEDVSRRGEGWVERYGHNEDAG